MNTTSISRDTTSDRSLLERIAQKDEEALSALYDRYSELVFSTAKRILERTGEAEEILQDIFYHVWRSADHFDEQKGSLAGWLLMATRNRAVSRLRRKSNRIEELDENSVILSVEIESHAAQKLLLDKVRKAMERLPDNQREALEYAYFEGMPHAAIAKKTGQSVETVKTSLHGAMDALKKVLS